MAKIVILGVAGQIARKLTKELLDQTSHDLVLFDRNLKQRLNLSENEQISIVEGIFEDRVALNHALEGADLVYLNTLEDVQHTQAVVASIEKLGVNRLIRETMAGIENEVSDPLISWTKDNLPDSYIKGEQDLADLVKASQLDYTLLRLTWLYVKAGGNNYEFVPSGQVFKDSEVSREAVVAAILEIMSDTTSRFHRASLGIGQPDTHYTKPSFY